jgi:hypothetical protein
VSVGTAASGEQPPDAAALLALRRRAAARLELQRRQQLAKYATLPDGPLHWLEDCVLTEDPHHKAQPLRPFPNADGWGRYLHICARKIIEFWMDPELAVLIVEKSRRMKFSWLGIALHCWAAEFIPHEYIFFGSRKLGLHEDEGSLEMVKRAKVILANQQTLPPPPVEEYRDRVVVGGTESHVIAVAQGKHQMRGPSATKVLLDEFATWEEARETWTSLRPTVESKGKILAISTPYPGLMKDLVFDVVGF